MRESILEVRNLQVEFATDEKLITAVDGISFQVHRGQTLGIVGESGSGKSTLARIVMGFEQPNSGAVALEGEPWSPAPEGSRRLRRSRIQLIEQNPGDALDPRWTVEAILREAVNLDSGPEPAQPSNLRVAELLQQVGLSPELRTRRPKTLNGGQKGRASHDYPVTRG